MSKQRDIQKKAEYLGFTIKEITGSALYSTRKGRVFALIDNRTGQQIATASSIFKLGEYLPLD